MPCAAGALSSWRRRPSPTSCLPWLYRDLLHGGDLLGLAVTLLAVRNALVLWLFVEAARQVVRCLEASEDEHATLSRVG